MAVAANDQRGRFRATNRSQKSKIAVAHAQTAHCFLMARSKLRLICATAFEKYCLFPLILQILVSIHHALSLLIGTFGGDCWVCRGWSFPHNLLLSRGEDKEYESFSQP